MRRPYLSIPVKRLGIMWRLHRRHAYLERCWHNFVALGRGREVILSIQLDRPSGDVVRTLEPLLKRVPSNWHLDMFDAREPLVDRRENYMEAADFHYQRLKAIADIDAASLWDDDMWLEREGVRELRGHLTQLNADRVYVQSRFLWDDTDHYNDAFPPHWQDIVFRCYPNDHYPRTFIAHCTEQVAHNPPIQMRNFLTNAGYLDPDDRRATWEAYKRAGKIDTHTKCLIESPKLRPT